jgi:hypothetical protein
MSAINIGGGRAGGVGISMFPSGALLSGRLNQWAGQIRSFEPVLQQIVREVVQPRIGQNFGGQTAAGENWAPLSENTPFMPYREAHNAAGSPPLDVTGRLKRVAQQQNIWAFDNRAGIAFVRDMPGAEYGEAQQQGFYNQGLQGGMGQVPARPFIVVNDEDIERGANIFDNWVSENFNRTVGYVADGETVGSIVSGGA